MMTPTDIAEYGERHVEAWLVANNFHCFHSEQRQGTKDLEARNGEDNLLIHVKVSLAPNPLPELTDAEHHSVCSRAMMLGFDPWCAQVQIGPGGELVGEVVWTKLQ